MTDESPSDAESPESPAPKTKSRLVLFGMIAVLISIILLLWSTGRYDAQAQANRYLDCFERQDAECIAGMITEEELKRWKIDRKIAAAFISRYVFSATSISREDCEFGQEDWRTAGLSIPYRTAGGNWDWSGFGLWLGPSGFENEILFEHLFTQSMRVADSDKYFALKPQSIYWFNAEMYRDFLDREIDELEKIGVTWYGDDISGSMSMRDFAAECSQAAINTKKHNLRRGFRY